MAPMYEYFDHTADVGIRLSAPDLNTLFADAGRAFMGLIVENVEDVRPEQEFEFHVEGAERDYLLFDWLSELVRHFESTGVVLSRFDVQVGTGGLTARGWGEPLDPARHHLGNEVKAVTYHQLAVGQSDGGWTAQVILDI
jgi:SHS2 domain-containing protein